MARAARLSGGSEPSEEEEEFHELQEKLKNPDRLTRFERMKYSVQQLVEKVGFFGILACASIPNPLFDLAGITCGHFLIPFWTFFGATLIGMKTGTSQPIWKVVGGKATGGLIVREGQHVGSRKFDDRLA